MLTESKSSKDSGAFASESFSRSLRLRRRRDFRYIQRVGSRGTTSALVVIGKRTPEGRGRVGLTVSRKVGKAHTRNLIKRRLRHLLRTHKEWFVARDIVIIVQPPAADMGFDALRESLSRAFLRMEESLAQNASHNARKRNARRRPGAARNKRNPPPKK